jgi:hypothetical protein
MNFSRFQDINSLNSFQIEGIVWQLNVYKSSLQGGCIFTMQYSRTTGIRFPRGAGNFSLRHRIQTGSGAHPAS